MFWAVHGEGQHFHQPCVTCTVNFTVFLQLLENRADTTVESLCHCRLSGRSAALDSARLSCCFLLNDCLQCRAETKSNKWRTSRALSSFWATRKSAMEKSIRSVRLHSINLEFTLQNFTVRGLDEVYCTLSCSMCKGSCPRFKGGQE